MALHFNEQLDELNAEFDSPAVAGKGLPIAKQLRLEILRLCRLGFRHKRNKQYPIALSMLERGLQLSETLMEINLQQGQYCAAMVLRRMGNIYYAQRYYLFALAAFQAALEAYQSLEGCDHRIESRLANTAQEIVRITEITNHPDTAIEYYLDTLWYWNSVDQQPKSKQIVQQLNKLCSAAQPALAQQ